MLVQKYTLLPGTSYATSYYVAQSVRPGPTAMIVAGIHGNETGSIQAARRLVRMLGTDELRLHTGRLVIVPTVNRRAYRQRIRGVPDLNRTFPRKAGQTAKHPLSAALFDTARRYRPSWYLDLHEANGLSQQNSKVLGQTLITNPGSRSVSAARKIIKGVNRTIRAKSQSFNLRLHELPGSSRTAAARILGARTVTVETGWSLPFSTRVQYQIDVVRRFLGEAGLTKS
ncbi:succinylglutamate desuccinylase/aspartoacylase family protein [Paenibacillus woosongensis]|uniref:Succinylglutamate desuccinylase/aspartoacylase family protein n=1 Tax=Paenibacillus woosongensis TaxID=307580 RepID=A0AA95L0W0_9BACL|nr:succinylglutamate desuccinylase/aspartoacylase family protein [Paenibacillus woosongensis]WHX47531.1 succinylglutamate desuccinylase/aspartoacylase family protein [Paenibacillus woosongensis]